MNEDVAGESPEPYVPAVVPMRKMSGLIAGIAGCIAFSQAQGAMPVDNTIAVRITGGTDAFYRVHYRHRGHGSSDHHRYQTGRYIYRPQPYYYSYPGYTGYSAPAYIGFDHGYHGHHFHHSGYLAWYGYSAPLYTPFDHGYGGHHFGGHLFEGHHLYGHDGHH